eukprot:2476209-Prymnesium_polylepis.1
MQTLIYSLSIGGGVVGGLLVVGTLVWFSRLMSSGTVQTPSSALQHSRWKHAHAMHIDLSTPVHIPTRHGAQGYRSRITPNA